MNPVVQSCFLTKNALTKMANKIEKNGCVYAKQQTKTLAQDMRISFHTKSWYGLESLFKDLPVSSFCPKKLHLIRVFISKMYY